MISGNIEESLYFKDLKINFKKISLYIVHFYKKEYSY